MNRTLAAMVAGLATVAAVLGTTPADSAVPTSPVRTKVIGMSAPANLWDQRVKDVGACGLEARRVFASLESNGKSQSTLIQRAVSAGMMPVIPYKVPNVDTLISGGYDSWLKATKTDLDGLQRPGVTVTFWTSRTATWTRPTSAPARRSS